MNARAQPSRAARHQPVFNRVRPTKLHLVPQFTLTLNVSWQSDPYPDLNPVTFFRCPHGNPEPHHFHKQHVIALMCQASRKKKTVPLALDEHWQFNALKVDQN